MKEILESVEHEVTFCLTVISNIIDYVHCFTTTHFLYDQVTITQTVSPFSSTTYIYNFEMKCYIMIVAALEIIYIYLSYRTFQNSSF